MNFDEVCIKKGQCYNLLSARRFEAIPMETRLDLIMNGRVTFLKDGKIIEPSEALRKASSGQDAEG